MSLPPLEELKRLQASLEHRRLTLGANPCTIFTVEDTQSGPEFGAEVARSKAEYLTYAFSLAPELLTEVIRLREENAQLQWHKGILETAVDVLLDLEEEEQQ